MRGLSRARRSLLALRSGGRTELLPAENRSVLAYRRAHPRSAPFLALTNFSDLTQDVDAGIIARAGLRDPQASACCPGTRTAVVTPASRILVTAAPRSSGSSGAECNC